MTKQIPLIRGTITLVDDQDFENLSKHKWFRHTDGYAATVIARRTVLMHRFIMQAPSGTQVDHKDGDRLNNQRANLRFATNGQNRHNSRKNRGCKSQFKGVSQDKRDGKWRATISINKRTITLGYFSDEISAALAYDTAAREYLGEFARPNFAEERATGIARTRDD